MVQEMYCYVGDLLGFSDIINNLNPSDQSGRVSQWTMLIEDNVRKHGITEYQLISDTVFAGTDNDAEGLEKIINFAKDMLEVGISKSLPIRGAISFGEVTWEPKISFGKAIVKAYNLANNQNWIGTACETTIASHIDSRNEKLWDLDKVVNYFVPMKNDIVKQMPVISWNLPPSSVARYTLVDRLVTYTLGGGLSRSGGNIKWSDELKRQNTIIFLIYLKILKNSHALMTMQGNKTLERFPLFLIKAANDPLKIIDMVLNENNVIVIPEYFTNGT